MPPRGGPRSTASADLDAALRRGGVAEAWDKLEAMQRDRVLVDRFVVSRMLAKTNVGGAASRGRALVYRAVRLAETSTEQNPGEADDALFNALLEKCSQLQDIQRLESVRERMRALHVSPSHVTLGTLVKAYGRAGDVANVLQLWEEMAEQRAHASVVTYGCMIHACTQCGHMEKAMEVFQDLKKRGDNRNTIVYSMLIKGHGQKNNVPGALELFREMKGVGLPYNTVSYNSMIDVCAKCSDMETAEELLAEMTAEGSFVEPDLITYSTMLKGYCSRGNLDRAWLVFQTMKRRRVKCDERVYNILLDGCVKANDLSAGVSLFREMACIGPPPSSITRNILVRLYRRSVAKGAALESVARLYHACGLGPPPSPEPCGRRSTSSLGQQDRLESSSGAAERVSPQEVQRQEPSNQQSRRSIRGNANSGSSGSGSAVVRDYCYFLSV